MAKRRIVNKEDIVIGDVFKIKHKPSFYIALSVHEFVAICQKINYTDSTHLVEGVPTTDLLQMIFIGNVREMA